MRQIERDINHEAKSVEKDIKKETGITQVEKEIK